MLSGVLVLAGVMGAASPEPSAITYDRDVEVAAAQITLDDVADLSPLPAPLRSKAGSLVLVRLPAARAADVRFTSRQLSERARGLMPALAPWLPATDDAVVRVRHSPSKPAPVAVGCLRTLPPVAAGAYPVAADFAAAPCGGTSAAAAFQYDRKTGLVRAARALAADEIVPAPPASTLAAVPPGQTLYLTATIGAVAVQREVVAVRAAGDGEPVTVRTRDGAVFSAPMSEFTQ